MNIVFVTASFEAERDGVADYVYGLSTELLRLGHKVRVLALYDSYIERSCGEAKKDGAFRLQVLRISRELSWNERVELAIPWIREFYPDWVSLQFVPWGFQSKGLPWQLHTQLSAISRSSNLHIMLHELWLGVSPTRSLKQRALGWLQRIVILRMLREMRPKIAHTSNSRYRSALLKYGINSEVLPLFSSIPIATKTGWAEQELIQLGKLDSTRPNWLILATFGAIHHAWQIEAGAWLREASDRARLSGKKVLVVGIGKIGSADQARFLKLEREVLNCVTVVHLGPQPSERISDFLQLVDAGLATVEESLLGKSSSVAAFKSHGVPIVVIRTDDQEDKSGARRRAMEVIDTLLNNKSRYIIARERLGPPDIVATLLTALKNT